MTKAPPNLNVRITQNRLGGNIKMGMAVKVGKKPFLVLPPTC